MPYRIKGTLKLPSGQPAAGVDIEFISRRNYSPLLMDLSSIIKTTSTGAYDITLEYGEYAVVVYWGCNHPSHIGKLFVFSDTAASLDLQTLLQQSDWQPATPEYIQQIQDWLAQAGASASQAVNSAAAAKASETAAEADRAEVASNKTIVVNAQADVSTKAADVTTKAAQVATNTATVNEKTPLAVAAADTASQKAVDAAASDASARDSAARAENAALAMTGAILDGGQCDLSSGFYPQPLTVNGKKYSTVWYVQVGGTVGGITYDAGDKLQYTTANNGFYFRIDARDDVVSVNGKKGAVTLNAQDVGADHAGTASSLVDQHAQKTGAHPISGVAGLTEALADRETKEGVSNAIDAHKAESHAHTPQNVGADPAGTATAAINALKSEPNPFPQYSDFRCGESRMFETRAQLAKRATEYHPMDGQLVPRATDQGLLAAIMTGEVPSCSDAEWIADPYKRNNYTLGDGSTNIRLPDRNGKCSGTVGSVFARGDGDNAPALGMIHGDASRRIVADFRTDSGWGFINPSGAFNDKGIAKQSSRFTPSPGTIPTTPYLNFDTGDITPTAPQNRPTSISQVWSVKR